MHELELVQERGIHREGHVQERDVQEMDVYMPGMCTGQGCVRDVYRRGIRTEEVHGVVVYSHSLSNLSALVQRPPPAPPAFLALNIMFLFDFP